MGESCDGVENLVKTKNTRDSRFEVLRIIAMLLIVLFHFSLQAQPYRLDEGSHNIIYIFLVRFFMPFGKIGVDIFVIITGYFLGGKVLSIKKSLERIWTVWSQSIFYSILLFVLYTIFNHKINKDYIIKAIKSIFPFITNGPYWFVTAFIMLMCLAPFITLMLKDLSKNHFLYLICLVTIFSSILPEIPKLRNLMFANGNGLAIILAPFLIGYYIRVFNPKIRYKRTILIVFILMFWGYQVAQFYFMGSLVESQGILPLVPACMIFLIFLEKKKFYNEKINNVARTSFSVYLLTSNVLVTVPLYKYLEFTNINNMVIVNLIGVLVSVLMLIISYFIDSIRLVIFRQCRIEKLIDLPFFRKS